MRIRVPQLVHDAVQEPQAHWRLQFAHDLLEHVILVLVLRPSVLQVLLSYVQHHCVDYRAAGLVGNVLILRFLHFSANLVNQGWRFGSEVLLHIVFESVCDEVVLVVAQNARFFHFVVNVQP